MKSRKLESRQGMFADNQGRYSETGLRRCGEWSVCSTDRLLKRHSKSFLAILYMQKGLLRQPPEMYLHSLQEIHG